LLTEPVLWAQWIESRLNVDPPVHIAALVEDDITGAAYEEQFAEWVGEHPETVASYEVSTYGFTDADVSSKIADLLSRDPDVFLHMSTRLQCTTVVSEFGSAARASDVAAMFTPSACEDSETFMVPAGDSADGFLIVGGGVKSLTNDELEEDLFISFMKEELALKGIDRSIRLAATGFGLSGWTQVELLRIATELPGGLSRSNLLLAMWGLDLVHPMLHDGLSFSTNGQEDAYLVEGSEIKQYHISSQSWIQIGDVIDVNGETSICSWSEDRCL
jgi:hypothetical protein